jgi:hypothetical protein
MSDQDAAASDRMPGFMLGAIVIDPDVHVAMARNGQSIVTLLERHARGDFGSVTPFLFTRNRHGVLNGYRLGDNTVICIRTADGRHKTQVDIEDNDAEGLL